MPDEPRDPVAFTCDGELSLLHTWTPGLLLYGVSGFNTLSNQYVCSPFEPTLVLSQSGSGWLVIDISEGNPTAASVLHHYPTLFWGWHTHKETHIERS